MKHIFQGSIHKKYYDAAINHRTVKLYLNEKSCPCEWKIIQTNNKIEFPLKKGDNVIVNNEKLCILNTIVDGDGSIICQTNKILDVLPDEVEKEYWENWISKINSDDKKVEIPKKSWLKRVFG